MNIKILLLAVAILATAGTARAQTAEMPRVTCEQAKQVLEQRSSVSRRQLSCVNEILIEVLVIDGQTYIAEVAYLSSEAARIRIDEAADEDEWRRNGNRPSYCWRDEYRYRRVCRRADLGDYGDCRGLVSGRRVDAATCNRWRRDLERR